MSTPDAFISYSSADAPFVRTIVDALAVAGLHIWKDDHEIEAGGRWMQRIEEILSKVPAFLACIGASPPDRWCLDEIEVALIRKQREPAFRVIPVLLSGADPASIPPFLALHSAFPFSDPSDAAQVKDIVNAIRGESSRDPRIDWRSVLRGAGAAQVESEVAALRNKYIAVTYTPRDAFDRDVAEFLSSGAQTLLILGEAGAGKTNFVCRLAEEQCTERPVFLFRCTTLLPGVNALEQAIVDVVEAASGLRPGRPLFSSLRRMLQGTRMLVIVDAINEAPNLVGCVEMIASSLQRAKGSPVQFCLTCRRSDWRFFRDDARITDSLWQTMAGGSSQSFQHGLVLERFSDVEVAQAWDKYRSYFHVGGELETEARQICKHPLMMRFICEAFRDRPLPQSLDTMDVFDRYWDAKVGHDPRRATALFTIALDLRRRRVGTLHEEAIIGLVDLDVYNALLSEEIILHVRVDRYTRVKVVGFMYEAFFEYCLARAILSVEGWQERDRATQLASVAALLEEAEDSRMFVGVVDFVILHFQEHEDLEAMLDLLDRSSEWKQRCCTLLPRFSGFGSRFAARLSRLAADEDYWVRWAACFATAQLGDDGDLDDLVKRWSISSKWQVRESAANVYAWRVITTERWANTVLLAGDPYWRVRRALANSLNRHLSRSTIPLERLRDLLKDPSWRRRDVGVIAQRDLAIAPGISRTLLEPLTQDTNERIRFSVAKFAGTLPSAPDFVPLLSRLACDDSAWVRKRVATSIVQFAASDAVGTLGVLSALSNDSSQSVRWEVARVLAAVPSNSSPETMRLLATLEADIVEDVRNAAAFSRRRSDGALPLEFVATLDAVSGSPLDVREAIARVVDLIRPPRHIHDQRTVLGAWKADYYLGIVRAIRLAWERLGSGRFEGVLSALLADPEEGVRWALAQTLSTIPIALDRRVWIAAALFADRHMWVRQAMVEEVPTDLIRDSAEVRRSLLTLIDDPDDEVRLALALGAQRFRADLGADGETMIEALRRDRDQEVRKIVGGIL